MANDLGKIHIYTGDGKGKTTSAFGLALRAIGAGYRVYIIQFMKGQNYSELKMLRRLPKLNFKRFGQKSFVHLPAAKKDKILGQKGIALAKKVLKSRGYDLVILDEIFVAAFFKLIKYSDITNLIKIKPKNVELVLTGRKATPEIMKLADYVTEMREIKHPYQQGVKARRGIEN
ncbi:MAG TPA: cob(I)yrinic acid a,c-diamide adenosyltransferase [Patescibacteria group bacterium]|nr:cob(I)yrinic acid a,c-diamide adenosyltransferase [Patescibacteria group bacterium]